MRSILGLLVVVVLCVAAWVAWVIQGHEGRTLARLLDTRAVSDTSHVKLLRSSGYLRENSHIFECPEAALLDEPHGGIHFSKLERAEANEATWRAHVQDLVASHIEPAIDWSTAEVRMGEGRGLLTLVFVVRTSTKNYLVLQVF